MHQGGREIHTRFGPILEDAQHVDVGPIWDAYRPVHLGDFEAESLAKGWRYEMRLSGAQRLDITFAGRASTLHRLDSFQG